MFDGDNEEDERKRRSLCDGLESATWGVVTWTAATMRASCSSPPLLLEVSALTRHHPDISVSEGDEDKRGIQRKCHFITDSSSLRT